MSQVGDMFEDLETVVEEPKKAAAKKKRKRAPKESGAETELPVQEEGEEKSARRSVAPEEQAEHDKYIENIMEKCRHEIDNKLSDRNSESFLNGVDNDSSLTEADRNKVSSGYAPHIPKNAFSKFFQQANVSRSDEGAKKTINTLVNSASQAVVTRALLDMAMAPGGGVTITPGNVQAAVDLMGKSFI